MLRPTQANSEERYVLEHGRYALYVGQARVLVTGAVAVLLDTRLRVLITHGDPASVRRELEAMRGIAAAAGTAHYERDWLFLSGRPRLAALNRALKRAVDVEALRDAFGAESADAELAGGADAAQARWIMRDLLARLRRPA